MHRLQEKGKTHKERSQKKKVGRDRCWSQSLSPLAGGKHWHMFLCTGCVFSSSDSPYATGAIQGNCLKVTSPRKTPAYYTYPYSSPAHYILLFSYSTSFSPFQTPSVATLLIFTLCQRDLWNSQSRSSKVSTHHASGGKRTKPPFPPWTKLVLPHLSCLCPSVCHGWVK